MEVSDLTSDTEMETQQILLAASQHNTPQLRILLRTGSASVQDPRDWLYSSSFRYRRLQAFIVTRTGL